MPTYIRVWTAAPVSAGLFAAGLSISTVVGAVTPDYFQRPLSRPVFANSTYDNGWQFLGSLSRLRRKRSRSGCAHRLPFLRFESADTLVVQLVADCTTRTTAEPV